ncbi:hypothetical protein LCER1_G002513 [Lachnellula cervina]|uniref:Heterokaryon incompatibility domain-containing protein n=1 Tax=Lachnellula cervina TaxID=1316786 RepID=A0A7D8YRS9_9HELO|nr:hypothetical protein LCER1_G002513 [Lachnellula cervina]
MARCDGCLNLQPETLSLLPPGQRAVCFVTIGDLKASIAASSCAECTLILNALSSHKINWDAKDDRQSVEIQMALGKPLRLFWRREAIYLELFSRPSSLSTKKTDVSTSIGPALEVAESSFSDSCFRLASSWLNTCTETHPACQLGAEPPLPTRVINVGAEGKQDPFLLESQSLRGQYVALSYCWGDPKVHPVLKTTPETYQKHQQCIDFTSLPKTLRDAVTITRRLGLQYLWIDALCIIQGDADDWARESSRMCEVYSNAYLTIAGSNAAGNADGIFNKQAYGMPPEEIPYKDGMTIYVRKHLARLHDNYAEMTRGSDKPEPINCRAWTLQEGFLSNRILRYTSNELVWECNEWRHCECGLSSAPIEPDDEASNRSIRKPDMVETLSLSDIYQKWVEVMTHASERQLGYEEDRLPAISGLAKQFVAAFERVGNPNEQYLAGLWRSNLARSLIWSIEDDRDRVGRYDVIEVRRPKAWRAPSWSSVSVEGPVRIPQISGFRSAIEVLEASTEPSTLDPYGQVASGNIVARGRVVYGLSITLKETTTGDEDYAYVHGERYAIHHGDMVKLIICDESGKKLSSAAETFSALLVGTIDGHLASREDVFLVLRSVSKREGEISTFERVGMSLSVAAELPLGMGLLAGKEFSEKLFSPKNNSSMFSNVVEEEIILV